MKNIFLVVARAFTPVNGIPTVAAALENLLICPDDFAPKLKILIDNVLSKLETLLYVGKSELFFFAAHRAYNAVVPSR